MDEKNSGESIDYKNEKKILEDIIKKQILELNQVHKELAIQREDKEKRAAELIIANIELVLQSEEKARRAEDLIIADIERVFQDEEKAKRAAELIIANIELAFQNEEKRKRAAELLITKIDLAFENKEKGKRAAELVIANIELAFQLKEKESRASELILINRSHADENQKKDKRASELEIVNKELEHFAYIASHDLQQPLRTVSNYMEIFEEIYVSHLDSGAQKYLDTVKGATNRMSSLIKSLLTFSQVGQSKNLVLIDFNKLVSEVIEDLDSLLTETKATIEVGTMPELKVYENEMRQLFQNLIINGIRFQKKNARPVINIISKELNNFWCFTISDNGIGIEEQYFETIFDIFTKLHGNREYEGSGIGLANCKKIVQLHRGEIWVTSKLHEGTSIHFTIPV